MTLLHKIGLHCAATFFAFQSRKIKINVLNEYRYNVAFVYFSVTVTVLTVAILVAIRRSPTFFSLVYSLMLFIACTGFLALTFIPMVNVLY